MVSINLKSHSLVYKTVKNWSFSHQRCLYIQQNMSRDLRKPIFAYAKTKIQISFVVTPAKLISAFVFATRDSTTPLLPKSEISGL